MRHRLPNRRKQRFLDFELNGINYTASVGFFPNGQIAELFLDGGKVGSMAEAVAREGAVLLSIALQHGVPLEELESALPKLEDGSPAGPIGKALKVASEK